MRGGGGTKKGKNDFSGALKEARMKKPAELFEFLFSATSSNWMASTNQCEIFCRFIIENWEIFFPFFSIGEIIVFESGKMGGAAVSGSGAGGVGILRLRVLFLTPHPPASVQYFTSVESNFKDRRLLC